MTFVLEELRMTLIEEFEGLTCIELVVALVGSDVYHACDAV